MAVMLLTLGLTVFLDLVTAVAVGMIAAAVTHARQFELLELDSVISVPILDSSFFGTDENQEDIDGSSARVGLVALRGSFTVASSSKLSGYHRRGHTGARGRYSGLHRHRLCGRQRCSRGGTTDRDRNGLRHPLHRDGARRSVCPQHPGVERAQARAFVPYSAIPGRRHEKSLPASWPTNTGFERLGGCRPNAATTYPPFSLRPGRRPPISSIPVGVFPLPARLPEPPAIHDAPIVVEPPSSFIV